MFFFFKGAHGFGFGHGALLLIDVSCSGFFFFFYSVVESRNPLPAQFIIYTNIDTHIRMETYAYICIYIYIFMKEGGSSNAEAQNHDLSQRVI